MLRAIWPCATRSSRPGRPEGRHAARGPWAARGHGGGLARPRMNSARRRGRRAGGDLRSSGARAPLQPAPDPPGPPSPPRRTAALARRRPAPRRALARRGRCAAAPRRAARRARRAESPRPARNSQGPGRARVALSESHPGGAVFIWTGPARQQDVERGMRAAMSTVAVPAGRWQVGKFTLRQTR